LRLFKIGFQALPAISHAISHICMRAHVLETDVLVAPFCSDAGASH
jgi:hypothetical protein